MEMIKLSTSNLYLNTVLMCNLVTFHNCQNWKFYGSTFARHVLKGAYCIKVMTDDWQALFSQLSDDKIF